jgi:uncharacterized protein (TIGR03067 family)
MNTFVALGLAIVVGAPGQKDAPKDKVPPLVGEWACTKLVGGGMELTELDGLQVSRMRFEFTADGKARVKQGDEFFEGTYTTNAKKDPAELDLSMAANGKDKTAELIYKVEKDTLVICMTKSGTERPTKFESPAGTRVMLITFTRVEKK